MRLKINKKTIKIGLLIFLLLFFGIKLVKCNHDYGYDTPQNNLKDAEWREFGDTISFGDWEIKVIKSEIGKIESSRAELNVQMSCKYNGSYKTYFDSPGEDAGIIFTLIYDNQYEFTRNLTYGPFWQQEYLPLEKKLGYITFDISRDVRVNEEKPLVFIVRENTVKSPVIYAFKIR